MARFLPPCLVLALLVLAVQHPSRADEPAAVDCEAWYDHYLTLRSADPTYAEAVGRAAQDQLALARQRYLADCEEVQATPTGHAEDRTLLTCTMAAKTLDDLRVCLDPFGAPAAPDPGEATANLAAIRTAQMAYEAAFDMFHPCAPTPATIPGENLAPLEGGGQGDFERLGWWSDFPVHCRYSVTVSADGSDFEARAECDLDGDGEIAVWRATRHEDVHCVTPEGVR